MAPPPAKRPKRSAKTGADEDDADITQESISGGRKSLTKRALSTDPVDTTKLLQKAKGPKYGNTKRSISSYFNAGGAPSQRHHVPLRISGSQNREPTKGTGKQETREAKGKEEEEEDIVEDITDNEDAEEGGVQHIYPLDRRKSAKETAVPNDEKVKGSRIRPNNSQRFKFSADTAAHTNQDTTLSTPDLRPWADRFGPLNLDELAVHKKKVSDVRQWLESVLSGRSRKRLLVVKGPAGAGKTATLKLLAKSLNLEISEWKNPVVTEYSSEAYTSMSTKFEDFLGRSGKFRKLDIEGQPVESGSSTDTRDHAKQILRERKLVLIEEFPNAFSSMSVALQSFRLTVLQYLATSLPHSMMYDPQKQISSADITPLIMIITETRPTSFTSPNESFTVHRLLGSEILHHPSVSQIEFNPVANTILRRALHLVLQKEARQSGRQRFPNVHMLNRLGEAGDVRSAIGSLEFLCKNTGNNEQWTGKDTVAPKSKTETPDEAHLQEDPVPSIIMGRESNVGLFHAVGKVVYNKRRPETEAPMVHPPEHLSEHARHLLPETSVDQLMSETGSDNETFIAALHENYAWSCEGSTMAENLESCLTVLSDGDLLLGSGHGFGRRGTLASSGTASESLRQDEIAFQSVVRGILFALPYPVNRSLSSKALSGKRSVNHGTFKMLYPTSMRIQRQSEEVQGLIEQWHLRLKSAVDLGSKPTRHDPRHPNARNVDSMDIFLRDADHLMGLSEEGNSHEPFRQSLVSTKSELILERLPYITKIKQQDDTSGQVVQLESITQFKGIQAAVAADDDDNSSSEEEFAKGTRAAAFDQGTLASGEMSRLELPDKEVEKLYLSDDDIEDD